MTVELLFWLYVYNKLCYIDEMSGEWEDEIPNLKEEAKELGIKWNSKYLWKTEEWLRENVK